MAPTRTRNDAGSKLLFAHRRMSADLVRLLGDWVDELDLGRLQRLPAEHVAADLRKRMADLSWWAPFKDDESSRKSLILLRSAARLFHF